MFVEAVLGQPKADECLSFFHRAAYKYRLAVSAIVIGEVVKAVAKEEIADKCMLWLKDTIQKNNIRILSVSYESISNVAAVRDSEHYIESADALNFSISATESCSAFITLDSDFTYKLENDFKLRIRKPHEF